MEVTSNHHVARLSARTGFCKLLTMTFCFCGPLWISACRNATDSAPPRSALASPRGEVQRNIIRIPPNSPKLDQIRTVPVRFQEVPIDEVTVPGKVEVNPNRVSRLLMAVPGRIKRVLAALGDSVVEGQTLVLIESQDAGLAFTAHSQAQAQLRQARSALNKAERDLARERDLYQHNAVAMKEVQTAEQELVEAQEALEQSRATAEETGHRIEMMGLKPGQHTHEVAIRAPISGKVLEIAVAPGEYRTDTSSSLMTIADLGSVWVSSEVPENAIRLIQPGERVEIELVAYPGEVLRGTVRRIADTLDPETRTLKVQAEMDNRGGRLRPEMFGKVRHTHGYRPLPVVPASAVVQDDGNTIVVVEKRRGEYQQVRVTAGEPRGGVVPILSGVSAGEVVVVDGALLVRASAESTP